MTSVLLRSALLGVASGSRSSLGLAAPVLTGGSAGRLRKAATLLAVAGELTGDKLPVTPARTAPPSLAGRLFAGASGGFALARRSGKGVVLPVLVGAAGAAAGTYGGLAWRTWADKRVPDWQAAVAEDAAAITLAKLAAGRSA